MQISSVPRTSHVQSDRGNYYLGEDREVCIVILSAAKNLVSRVPSLSTHPEPFTTFEGKLREGSVESMGGNAVWLLERLSLI